jgi:hypothetical protein
MTLYGHGLFFNGIHFLHFLVMLIVGYLFVFWFRGLAAWADKHCILNFFHDFR